VAKNRQQTAIVARAEYQGPLPLPAHFREYEEILPGAAERILALAERQSSHRQELEKHVMRGDGHRAWAGLIVGGVLAMACIVGGVWLVSLGSTAGGVSIATSSVVAIAAVFVYGTRSRRDERGQRPGRGRG
jgi:uncharacterized membrane protein